MSKKFKKIKDAFRNVKDYYSQYEKPKLKKPKRIPLEIVREWEDVPDSLKTRYVQFFSLTFICIAFAIISVFVLKSWLSCIIWVALAYADYRYSVFLKALFCSTRMDQVAGHVTESVRNNLNKVFNTTSVKVYDEDREEEITVLFQNKHRIRQSKNIHYHNGDYLIVYFDKKSAPEIERKRLDHYFVIDKLSELSEKKQTEEDNFDEEVEE